MRFVIEGGSMLGEYDGKMVMRSPGAEDVFIGKSRDVSLFACSGPSKSCDYFDSQR